MIDLDAYLPEIVAGDSSAFGRWMAGAEPSLRLGLRRFAAAVDVEAVLQEALLRLWQVAPRFQPDGRPNGLLRLAAQIAKNLAISEMRRSRPSAVDQADLEDRIEDESPIALPDPMLRRVIEGCRDKLPPKPRAALDARLQSAGADPDERLAELAGMRKNTFLQNFTRARKFLADCLRAHGVELAMEAP
jgi:RNA polymerase sigma-70 factor (ECF subfamily)